MNTSRNYEKVRESREWYFVEYSPFRSSLQSAILNLVIVIETADINDIATAMEKELKDWLEKYPVPLSVYAYNNQEDLYNLDEINKRNPLIGFLNNEGELVENEKLPTITFDQEYLDKLYSNIKFVTDSEYDADKQKRRRQIRMGYELFLVFPFVVTMIYESFVYFNKLFSLLAFFYIIYKAIQRTLRFTGMWPKSKKEDKKEREERLKEHYYYFCEMNPEGFQRLKREALEKMTKERVKKEAESLHINKGTS